METILSCKAFLGAQDCSYISGPATCWWDFFQVGKMLPCFSLLIAPPSLGLSACIAFLSYTYNKNSVFITTKK
jgi:hypothetical protein